MPAMSQATAVRNTYNLEAPCPTVQLRTGASIPLLGLGTWKSAPGQVHAAVAAGLRAGYRHIDAAQIYGNEDEVGSALAEVFAEGVISRADVFVTSKLWNAHHNEAPAALARTLKSLQLTYLDLYLVHWPVSGNVGPVIVPALQATWTAMEALHATGQVRAIGISNYSIVKMKALMAAATIKPAVNQVEIHPYWRNDALVQYCQSVDIHVTAYSPLGSPDSATMMARGADMPVVMNDPVVAAVAANLGKTVAQVLIRWAIQHGTSVLPKSVNADRIKANMDCVSWEIPAAEYALLGALPQMRMLGGAPMCNPEGPYKTPAELWDEPAL